MDTAPHTVEAGLLQVGKIAQFERHAEGTWEAFPRDSGLHIGRGAACETRDH